MSSLFKKADSDPASVASPLPSVSVETSFASGKKGPVGLAPRTNYSRVNTGAPPSPDAGASDQKSMPPMGASMLPKMASEGFMGSIASRPTIQDMVKAACAGSASRLQVSEEAARQMSFSKIASDEDKKCPKCGKDMDKCSCMNKSAHVPTDYAMKLAEALEYAAEQHKEASTLVGQGPNATTVLESNVGGHPPDAGQQGHATAAHIPPKTPGLQSAGHGPANQMANNMDHAPGGGGTQQVAVTAGHGSKTAASFLFAPVLGAALGHRKATEAAGQNEGLEGAVRGGLGATAGSALGGFLGSAGGPAIGLLGDITGGAAGYHLATQKYNASKDGPPKTASVVDKAKSVGAAIKAHAKSVGEAAGSGAETVKSHAKRLAYKAEGAASGLKEHASNLSGHSNFQKAKALKETAKEHGEQARQLASHAAPASWRTPHEELAQAAKSQSRKEVAKGVGKALAGAGAVGGAAAGAHYAFKKKEGSAPIAEIRKVAEDAINPAHISAGPAAPNSGLDAAQPVGGFPGNSGLIASNESAINYNKGQAKSPSKSDMHSYVNEPALSGAHDKTLAEAFSHTGQAGTKFASLAEMGAQPTKTAAARALLEKIAEAAEEKSKAKDGKKEKDATGFQAPAVNPGSGPMGQYT